jgi:hypothetical protein
MIERKVEDFVALSRGEAEAMLLEWRLMQREIDKLKEDLSTAELMHQKLQMEVRHSK